MWRKWFNDRERPLQPAGGHGRAAATTRRGLGEADDAELMEAVGSGNTAAFEMLVMRHTDRLYRVALRMLADTHEAEDVVQDCFTRMWQHAPGWQPSGAGLVGWLYRLTVNLCFDRRRRGLMLVIPGELPDVPDHAPLTDRVIEANQVSQALLAALADLPERYRAALVLCYLSELTNSEAAEILQINLKAMESLLIRARRQLRQVLQRGAFTAHDMLAAGEERAA